MGLFTILKSILGKRPEKPSHGSTSAMPEKISNESFQRISAAASLANATVEVAQHIEDSSAGEYLCKSKLTCADTALFSCFILRALCIMSTNNHTAAAEFSDEYVSSVIELAYNKFMPDKTLFEMFDSRMAFYDRVFAKQIGVEKKITAVLEEFEYVIKNDIIEGKYVPFSEKSPLPILGINRDIECQMEIQTFFPFLLKYVDTPLNKAMESIK